MLTPENNGDKDRLHALRGQVYLALVPQRMLRLLPQHTSAYVSIRQHTGASLSGTGSTAHAVPASSVYVSIRQHTGAGLSGTGSAEHAAPASSAYVSIRQHTSAYVSLRGQVYLALVPQRMLRLLSHDNLSSAYVSIRQHTSAYVSIRQHTPAPACS